jgi:Rieske 2Fe-2S family protein
MPSCASLIVTFAANLAGNCAKNSPHGENINASRRCAHRGQFALARQIVDGCTRTAQGISKVPASVYTDPAHWEREKALMFGRAPQVLCPSALMPGTQHGGAARYHWPAAAGNPRWGWKGARFPQRLPPRGTRLVEGSEVQCSRG